MIPNVLISYNFKRTRGTLILDHSSIILNQQLAISIGSETATGPILPSIIGDEITDLEVITAQLL